jgi:hypothetical protein
VLEHLLSGLLLRDPPVYQVELVGVLERDCVDRGADVGSRELLELFDLPGGGDGVVEPAKEVDAVLLVAGDPPPFDVGDVADAFTEESLRRAS